MLEETIDAVLFRHGEALKLLKVQYASKRIQQQKAIELRQQKALQEPPKNWWEQ